MPCRKTKGEKHWIFGGQSCAQKRFGGYFAPEMFRGEIVFSGANLPPEIRFWGNVFRGKNTSPKTQFPAQSPPKNSKKKSRKKKKKKPFKRDMAG